MATALQVNDILAVRAWTELDGQGAVNTYHFDVATISGGACTDQDLADDLNTPFAAFYKSLCGNTVEYKGLQVYFARRSGPLPNAVKNTASAGPCAAGINSIPKVAAAILKYGTPLRGPGGRGRVYLPFVYTGYADINGRPSTGLDVLVNSFASNLLTPVALTNGASTATLVWGILHRSGLPFPFTQITSAESADKFGQMHKRGDYGRPNNAPI